MKSENMLRRTWPWSHYPFPSRSLGWQGWVTSGDLLFLVRDAVLWPAALVIVAEFVRNASRDDSRIGARGDSGPMFRIGCGDGPEVAASYADDVDFGALDPEPAGEREVQYTFTGTPAGGSVQLVVSPPPAAGAVTLWVDWPTRGMSGQSLRRQLV